MKDLPHNHHQEHSDSFDVAVIGGGASGLAAAIAASRSDARVCILERDVAVGLSILATGNGRCNISNANLDPEHYLHPRTARTVMGNCAERDVTAFFENLGLLMAQECEGRLYPRTRRAESVRDVLLDACSRQRVSLRCGTEVTAARYDRGAGVWVLTISEPAAPLRPKAGHDSKAKLRNARKALSMAPRRARELYARRVIIACGGTSEDIAQLFNLPHLPETPLLSPIACTPITLARDVLKSLDGLRVEAVCTLMRDGRLLTSQHGELLFRPYGISGIAAFNLSRHTRAGDALEIDLFPELSNKELTDLLERRRSLLGPLTPENPSWFDGLLAPALARAVCSAGVTSDASALATALKHLTFAVTGLSELKQAQVRRGGIPFDTIDLPSLAVRRDIAPSLFACGEALDMDADCGGYNLAWAWLSGIRAGKEASRA